MAVYFTYTSTLRTLGFWVIPELKRLPYLLAQSSQKHHRLGCRPRMACHSRLSQKTGVNRKPRQRNPWTIVLVHITTGTLDNYFLQQNEILVHSSGLQSTNHSSNTIHMSFKQCTGRCQPHKGFKRVAQVLCKQNVDHPRLLGPTHLQ